MSVPERYSPEASHSSRMRLEHEARYRFAAQFASGHDVLDLGAGAGQGALACLEVGAKSVAAADSSSEACALARKALAGFKNVKIVEASVGSLPWKSAAFDLVLFLEVIEHLSDPNAALGTIRKILRPDGFLLVSTPAREEAPNLHHERLFTKAELGALLRKHFPHVRLFRQYSLAGSAVIADAKDEAQVSLRSGQADYWIALASARKIVKRVTPILEAGSVGDYEADTLRRLESDIRHLQQENEGLRRDLRELRRSFRWRLTGRVLRWMGFPE